MKKAVWRLSLALSLCLFALGTAGCGDSPQQMFETAQFEELQNNRGHARELYERIVQNYPDSEVAKKAEQRLVELGKTPPR